MNQRAFSAPFTPTFLLRTTSTGTRYPLLMQLLAASGRGYRWEREPFPVPTIGSEIPKMIQPYGFTATHAVQVVGRLAQLACLFVVYFGCQKVGELWEAITLWQQGEADLAAVCDRVLRVTVPVWLGSAFLVFCEINLRHDRRTSRQLAKNPDAPWLANSDWQGAVIKTSNRKVWLVFITCLMTAIVIGLPIAGSIWSGTIVRNLGVGIALLSLAFALTQWRMRGWTNATLRLGHSPGVVGGPLTGVVQIYRSFAFDTIFAAGLQCTYRLPSSPDDDTTRERKIHWASTVEVRQPLESSQGTVIIPVHFSIPFDCPSSTVIPTSDVDMQDVRWSLMVHEKDRADRGIAIFSVPVFKTAESRRNYEPDQELLDGFQPTYEALQVLQKFKFQEIVTADGRRTITFLLREQSMWKVAVIASMICVAAIVALLYLVPILTISLFLSIMPAVVLFAIAHNIVEAILGSSELVLEHNQLQIRSGMFKPRLSLQCVADSRTRLWCAVDMQSQNQLLESWNLGIRTEDRSERLLIKQVGSQREVEAVQKWLAERLGLGIEPITVEKGYSEKQLQSNRQKASTAGVKSKSQSRQKKSKR